MNLDINYWFAGTTLAFITISKYLSPAIKQFLDRIRYEKIIAELNSIDSEIITKITHIQFCDIDLIQKLEENKEKILHRLNKLQFQILKKEFYTFYYEDKAGIIYNKIAKLKNLVTNISISDFFDIRRINIQETTLYIPIRE